VTAFERLHPEIRKLLAGQGIFEPTAPQELAIPPILQGEHVLLIAPTGTGKTEAAGLPLFHQILSVGGEGNRALYITPLRALNRDMLRRFQDWGSFLGITVAVRHGDTTQCERARQSRKPPQLLITTPETLQVMLTGKRLRRNLAGVRMVVVDEVHELASSKRGSQLAVLLERLVEVAGEFQRVGLSATVGSPEEVARLLAGSSRPCRIVNADVERANRFQVASPKATRADHALARELECEPALAAQIRWIRDTARKRKCLIFVNTRQAAEVLGSRFKQLGEPIGVHHGSLSRDARIEAEEAFKDGMLQGLICTSSMELGIDIGDVDHVIQYSSPREVARLLQRVGRSGHKIGMTSSGTIIATGPDDIAEACAIARRADQGRLEDILIHHKPLDVLANQVVGLALDFGELDMERAMQIVTRSYPFRDLTREELERVVYELQDHRLVREEEGVIQRRRKGLEYYYENLSMIPDEKRYEVYDMVSRKPVGTLDEAFVINFANPGATFITRGEIWEIAEIEDDRIKVVPIHRSGEIPSWTGEEIPVPFLVAQEVGEIRARVAALLEEGETDPVGEDCGGEESGGVDAEGIDAEGRDGSGAGKAEIEGGDDNGDGAKGLEMESSRAGCGRTVAAVRMLQECYPVDIEASEELVGLIRRQMSKNLEVPDHRTITVESDGPTVVINACLGHKANDALGRVITALLSSRFGSSVGMEIDPYRITLELPRTVLPEEVISMLDQLNPDHVKTILELTLKNTTLLRWKMVHVARKFGALRRDIDYERVSMVRLLGIFEETPMYEEALREIFQDRLDVVRAGEVLERVRSGEIRVLASPTSPIGSAGRGGGRDVASPEHADGAVLDLLKSRIMSDHIILFCVNCKKWKSNREVNRVPETPECPLCGSRMVAALKPWEDEEIKVVRKPEKRKTAEDRRRTRRVYRNANLVLSHGRTAAIVLASRGLGPETAARVIRKLQTSEEEFYRDILRAERDYARTKRFWS